MSDISILGLGLMGGALARAFLQAGHKILVWNRSPEKMGPFVDEGATGAPSVASAVTASPVILVCVDNYSVTQRFLDTDEVAPHLSGRTLIQLSTGMPREAREAAIWFNERGMAYIDGAMLASPTNIGKDAQILFAGPETAFRSVEQLLKCLGSNLRYLGENVRAPAALDLAWLCVRFGIIIGAIHGVNLCESEEVGADVYATLFPDGDRARMVSEVIDQKAYGNPSATVRVWQAVLQRLQEQAQLARINKEFPEFGAGIVERAMTAGYGDEDVAALIKILRGNRL
jgi:3-hydroxyisobutyrate dehydrogenase-like beta-hydroxyacid dehydrogenase